MTMASTYLKGELTPYPDGFTTTRVETNGRRSIPEWAVAERPSCCCTATA